LKNCKFLFCPLWLGINLFIYFYNVVKMVIIHNKITTFGYRQVVCLETCLNLSKIWLFTIYYCKKLTIYILNLAQKTFLSKKSFFWCCRPLNLANVGHEKKKNSKALNSSNCHKILCFFLLQHKPTTTLNETI